MTPDEIRALYVETLARADFAHFCKTSTWEEIDEADRQTWIPNAERAVTALAEAGLLPTRMQILAAMEGEGSIADRTTHRCFLTDWREVSE